MQEEQRIVTVPLAALWESPEPDALLADELLCGTAATVLEQQEDGWARVAAAHRYCGWLRLEQLGCGGRSAARWVQGTRLVVTAPCADLLTQPRMRSRPLLTLPHGSLVAPCGGRREDDWQAVRAADGQLGFLRGLHLEQWPVGGGLREAALRQSLTSTALGFLGASYRWGGKTPWGVDCSGLVSQVYLDHGIVLWRDSDLRDGFAAHAIGREELLPADLIYWRGHVAMYLGNSRYIHANATHGGVCINSLNTADSDCRHDLAGTVLGYGSIF